MRLAPHPDSLVGHAYRRTGSMVKASHVVSFMVCWDMCRRSIGREPTVAEYSEWWKQTERASYAELERFRAAFGLDVGTTPSVILDRVADAWDRRQGAKGLAAAVLA